MPRMKPNNYQYYYEKLTLSEQESYRILLESICEYKRSVTLSSSTTEQVARVNKAIRFDHPEIFYLKCIRVASNQMISMTVVFMDYRFDKATIKAILAEMRKRTDPFISQIRSLPEYERIKRIHDHLAHLFSYKDYEEPYSHEAPGAILYGIAVCEGVAKAFKYLADRANIRSIIVSGEGEQSEEHAWNIVCISNQSYHVDVTFDAVLSSRETRYDYFLLSDKQISQDHTWEDAPMCRDNFDYYEDIGHLVRNRHELSALIKTNLITDHSLAFQLPILNTETEALISAITELISTSIPQEIQATHNLHMSYNLRRMVFCIELSNQ